MTESNTKPASKLTAMELISRAALASRLGYTYSGDRELHTVLGYKTTLDFDDYYAHYQRGDIAKRIVNAYPDGTWRLGPTVTEDKESDTDTAFEAAWKELCDKRRVIHYLRRADRLACLGRFAILLIGLRGESDLSKPLEKRSRSPEDVIYLAAYGENAASVEKYTTDPKDPNYGRPELYKIAANTEIGTKEFMVHYSRVIHVADGLLDNDVFGTPKLEAVFNKLSDLMKVVGGAAEIYWRDAKRGMAFGLKDGYDTLTDAQKENLSDEIEDFYNGLKRYMTLEGIEAKELFGNAGVDPSGIVSTLLDLIAGTLGMPKRILIGSERGELASSQDEDNWNARLQERQTDFAEPFVLRPLIDKLIDVGVLPAPAKGYEVEWPDLMAMGDDEKAAVLKIKAETLRAYTADPELIVPREEFREKFLELDPEPEGGFPEEPEPVDETDPEIIEQFGKAKGQPDEAAV